MQYDKKLLSTKKITMPMTTKSLVGKDNPEPIKAIAIPKEETLILAGDPEQQMAYAVKSSKILIQILKQKPKKVMINGEQYLEFEDWQTLGRFYGASVGVEWTKPIVKDGKNWGYEAKAIVLIKGEMVSSAESMCTRDERNWATRDEFTLRSMAQTRASAKALRNVLAWVAVLGGFKPTPVEEMPDEMPRQYVPNTETNEPPFESEPKDVTQNQEKTVTPENGAVRCEICNAGLTTAVATFSQRAYKKNLCFVHQKEVAKAPAEPYGN